MVAPPRRDGAAGPQSVTDCRHLELEVDLPSANHDFHDLDASPLSDCLSARGSLIKSNSLTSIAAYEIRPGCLHDAQHPPSINSQRARDPKNDHLITPRNITSPTPLCFQNGRSMGIPLGKRRQLLHTHDKLSRSATPRSALEPQQQSARVHLGSGLALAER